MITRTHEKMFATSQAVFSDDEQHRYYLERRWGAGKLLGWLMLNPSTADELANDPTIERCQRRALAMGYEGIVIVNLFPFRMTDSKMLHTAPNLLGEAAGQIANNYILHAFICCDMVICGWGSHELAASRAKDVLEMIGRNGLSQKIHCLVLNKDNSPRHPLYIGYDHQPQPYEIAA